MRSVDGLHASDLTQWIMLRPDSTLAALAGRGTIYPNARTPTPSDSFPGLLALITGAFPFTPAYHLCIQRTSVLAEICQNRFNTIYLNEVVNYLFPHCTSTGIIHPI